MKAALPVHAIPRQGGSVMANTAPPAPPAASSSPPCACASPRAIALSLKRSALASPRRKTNPYRSALSMLTFYVNRAGRGLSVARRRKLERAKGELRAVFGKEASSS